MMKVQTQFRCLEIIKLYNDGNPCHCIKFANRYGEQNLPRHYSADRFGDATVSIFTWQEAHGFEVGKCYYISLDGTPHPEVQFGEPVPRRKPMENVLQKPLPEELRERV